MANKAYNKVVESVYTGTAVHGGKVRPVEIATKTANWQRPTEIAKNGYEAFKRSLAVHPDKLPEGTAKLVVREMAHDSSSDWTSHYTAGAVDSKGELLSSIHIHAEDEPREDKKVGKKKKKDSKRDQHAPGEQLNTCDIEISGGRVRKELDDQTTLRLPTGRESMAAVVQL